MPTEHLVHTWSEDGVRLDGALFAPTDGAASWTLALIPGLYAAFYDDPYPALARALAARGVQTVVGNTRGHDFGAVLRRRDHTITPGGGGWERFADAPLDVGGWLAFAADLGGGARLLLGGHSFGARKAALYQAERGDGRVVGLVLASPRVTFPPPAAALLAQARALVAAGRGRELLPWPAVGCSMSAATFLDQEAPDAASRRVFAADRGPATVARISVPLLVFHGGAERDDDGRDRTAEQEILRAHATAAPRQLTAMIPDGDHLYHGQEDAVAALIAAWAMTL